MMQWFARARRFLWYYALCYCWWFGDRPRRMWRHGRGIDATLDATEVLYLRVAAGNVANGRLDVGAIRFPDQSVNRSRYSRKEDLLFPEPETPASQLWLYLGVCAFPADAVPTRIFNDGGDVVCDVRVEHDPIEHNYGHAEIRAYVQGKRIGDQHKKKGISGLSKQQWKIKRMEWRDEIRKTASIEVNPV